MIYYLKTKDETTLWNKLESAGLAVKEYDPQDELNTRPADLDIETEWSPTGAFEWRFTGEALDIIGSIYTNTGNMLTDDHGNEYPETELVDGFHANLMTDKPIDGLPTVSSPTTPYRVWAGVRPQLDEDVSADDAIPNENTEAE